MKIVLRNYVIGMKIGESQEWACTFCWETFPSADQFTSHFAEKHRKPNWEKEHEHLKLKVKVSVGI